MSRTPPTPTTRRMRRRLAAGAAAAAACAAYGLLVGAAPPAQAAPVDVTTPTAALAQLQSAGDTDVRLGADITITQPVVVTATVTVDLDGHDLTIAPPVSATPADPGATALAINGGTLDISGEGLVTLRGGDGAPGTPAHPDGSAGGPGLAFPSYGVLDAVAIDIDGGDGGAGVSATTPGQDGGNGGPGGAAIAVGSFTLQAHSGSTLILDARGGSGGAGGAGGAATSGAAGDGGFGGAGAFGLGINARINTPVDAMVSMIGGIGGAGGAGGDATGSATTAGAGGAGGAGASGSDDNGLFAGVAGNGGRGGRGGNSSVAGVAGGDGGAGGDSARGGAGTMSVSGSGGPGGAGGTAGSGASAGANGAPGADGASPIPPVWGVAPTAQFLLDTPDGTVRYFAYPGHTTTAQQWVDALPAWWPSGLGVPFYGWSSAPDGTGSPPGSEVLDGTPFATYYSTSAQPQRTVTFDGNGGPGAGTVTVGYGDPVREPEAPVRAGYAFEGWYDAAGSNGAAWDFSTTITSNVTLYAHWSVRAAPATSTPATPTSTPAGVATQPTAGAGSGGPLADTGVEVIPAGLVALALLAGGALLLTIGRRRGTGSHT